jgi:hypothetical protein
MRNMRFLRDAKGKKLGVILSMAEFETLSEVSDETECIRAYDAAKASGEAPIPYEQVLPRIEGSRKRPIQTHE